MMSVPDECTIQTCDNTPEYAVHLEHDVSHHKEGHVSPAVCSRHKRENIHRIASDKWVSIGENIEAMEGGD